MKSEPKLHRIIRKIVKEELEKQHHEPQPHPFPDEEQHPWTLFDEHPSLHEESAHRHFESSRNQELPSESFSNLSEPLQNEALAFQSFHSKQRRRKRRR